MNAPAFDHTPHTIFPRRILRAENGRVIAPQSEMTFDREPFALVVEGIQTTPAPTAQTQEFTRDLFTL